MYDCLGWIDALPALSVCSSAIVKNWNSLGNFHQLRGIDILIKQLREFSFSFLGIWTNIYHHLYKIMHKFKVNRGMASQKSKSETDMLAIKYRNVAKQEAIFRNLLEMKGLAKVAPAPPTDSPILDPIESKKKVINAACYDRIADYVNEYRGLSIDCEIAMLHRQFMDVHPLVLKGVIQAERGNRLSTQYTRYKSRAKKYLRAYQRLSDSSKDDYLLVNLARKKRLGPVMLCRLVLQAKYGITSKTHLAQLIKSTDLIEDALLAVNVKRCITMDTLDGPLCTDVQTAIDDNFRGRFLFLWMRLRNVPNFKTLIIHEQDDPNEPDFQTHKPFMYRDSKEPVSWIQSMARFGDIESHKKLLKHKLKKLAQLYGAGLLIYWYGYHEDILQNPDNNNCVSILCDFPKDIQMLP